MEGKKNILFYSGHGETVGGDAKYFFDLICHVKRDKYEITALADKNYVFEQRAEQWLSKNIPITYLNTWPALFKKRRGQILIESIAVSEGKNALTKGIIAFLNYKLLDRGVYKWISRAWCLLADALTFAWLRNHAHNVRLFYGLIKKSKPDIFHFNNGGYPAKESGLIAVIVAHFCGVKKTIMTVQNLPEKRKWHKLSDLIFDALMSKCCDTIITVSENARQEMNRRRRFPLNRIVTIFHGLNDVKIFSEEEIQSKRKEFNLKMDAPIILITANLDENRKGHTVLIRSLKDVTMKYPQVTLLVVGDGKKKNELMQLCAHLNLSRNVVFCGHRSDIGEINGMIDVAVVPSIDFEGIPYTIREAMRAGKPVIATDAGGCAEAVVHGANGLIVPQNDSLALTKAILQLLGDKTSREQMGANGYAMFKEKFFLPNKMIEHENIYDQLLI